MAGIQYDMKNILDIPLWERMQDQLAKNSNIRDYASIAELTVLSNLETHNAELIKQGLGSIPNFV